MKMKAIGGGVLIACVMTLALVGKVTGESALTAIEAIGAAWFGATAILGGTQAIADAMRKTP